MDYWHQTETTNGLRAPGRDLLYVWVPAGSLAGFLLGAFWRSGRPRGPGNAFKLWGGVAPPTFLRALPGPRSRPDPNNAPKQNLARLPSSTQ